jgi:NAD(P)-dependent dehydrogenase (short-subunit alcohol dehydrogenase family)
MSSLKELRNLNGRCALITGANGSLGRVMAETLAELGADLILVDRCNLNFDELSKSLAKRWDVEVECFICDLEFQAERTELISHLKVSGRLINILINNAAFVGTSEISGWNVPFQQQTVETWRRAIEVNLTAIFELTQGITPLLQLAKGANIINIASIYGEYGPNWNLYEGTSMSNPAAYGVSKGGLIQLTRWLSTTISPNIRVNAISPGGVFRNQPKDFVERYKARTPLARMATEDDFRGVIAFLASDLSAYITGQTIRVDGGWGVW